MSTESNILKTCIITTILDCRYGLEAILLPVIFSNSPALFYSGNISYRHMRHLYYKLIPFEARYWLYKLRHPAEFRKLRNIVHHSPKGDFSLRSYDKLECIFIHITKSAGTSVAKSLFGELPYHYTAAQYRVIYGREKFGRYFKFAFVRNPWDRLYSAYSYLQGGGWNDKDKTWAKENLAEFHDFNDFVLNWLTPERLYSHVHFWPQQRFICDRKGKILVDHIAYFENIDDEFKYLSNCLNLPNRLTHTNKSDRINYTEAYTEEAIEKVRLLYRPDIELLGYSFDNITKPAPLKL